MGIPLSVYHAHLYFSCNIHAYIHLACKRGGLFVPRALKSVVLVSHWRFLTQPRTSYPNLACPRGFPDYSQSGACAVSTVTGSDSTTWYLDPITANKNMRTRAVYVTNDLKYIIHKY